MNNVSSSKSQLEDGDFHSLVPQSEQNEDFSADDDQDQLATDNEFLRKDQGFALRQVIDAQKEENKYRNDQLE